jgi:hypothetical protein
MNKTKVREELKWTGEETNFAEMVNHFCWNFLFPKFINKLLNKLPLILQFLKDGWKTFAFILTYNQMYCILEH